MTGVGMLEFLGLVFVALAVILGCTRLFLGPTAPDRVVAADTLAVITTAGLAWLAGTLNNPVYLDIALVYGALAFVGVVAIARALEATRP